MQFRIAHALIMRRVHFSTFNAEAGGHPQNSRFAAHGRPCANYVRNSSTHTQRFVRIKWVRVGIREGISMPLSEIVASKLLPCPKCGSLVWLARIMPDELECDQPTFEC